LSILFRALDIARRPKLVYKLIKINDLARKELGMPDQDQKMHDIQIHLSGTAVAAVVLLLAKQIKAEKKSFTTSDCVDEAAALIKKEKHRILELLRP